MKIACSVIIPTLNSEKYIAQALQSLLQQTRIPDEILVIDNGSSDQTRRLVSKFPPPVRLLLEPRRGAAAARNCGILEAKGDFIAFLDADDISLPQRIERQIQALTLSPKAAMVFCSMAYVDKDLRLSGIVSRCENFRCKEFFGRLVERNQIGSTSVAMTRKSVLLEVGVFDEKITHNEEYDLWLRIAAKHPVTYLDEILVHYRIHKGNISHEIVRQRYNEKRAINKYSIDHIMQALKQAYPKDWLRQQMALATFYLRLNNLCAAASLLNQIWSKRVREADIAFLLGVSNQRLGCELSAESFYRSCITLSPKYAAAYNNLGVLQARRGILNAAEENFKTASCLNSNYTDPVFNLKILSGEEKDINGRITPLPLRKNLKPDFSLSAYR